MMRCKMFGRVDNTKLTQSYGENKRTYCSIMKAKPRLISELDRDSRLEVTRRGTPWCGSISAIVRSNFPEKF